MVRPAQVWFKLFGDQLNSDSPDMDVDGSSTPVHFDVVASGRAWVHQVNLEIIANGMTPTEFGGLNSALSNGLLFRVLNSSNSVLVDFLDGEPIKKNADFSLLTGADVPVIAAAGDDHDPVRWSIVSSLGEPLELEDGEKLRITVQDNLTSAVTSFRAMAQGTT